MSTKNNVLQLLEHNRGRDISGQEIADRLHISRAAVWKAIQRLEKEGYPIRALPRVGYRLASTSNILSKEGIQCHLLEPYRNIPIYVYDCIDSTNIRMKELSAAGEIHYAIVTANAQTSGKGRYGRSFYSPEQTGIYMTLLLKEKKTIQDATTITMIAANAVCRIIEQHSDDYPEIKWVNDIFINQRKVVGILSEAMIDFESGMSESVILGIGINVSTTDFPKDLTNIAGSISQINCSRNQMIAEITNEIFQCYETNDRTQILEEYRKRSCILHKTINFTWNHERHQGYVKDINDQGNLVIEKEGKEYVLTSGEISVNLHEK